MNMKIIIPEREIKFKFARSSGPGGQNVNRRETKVQVRWNIDTSEILDEEQKKQLQNKLSLTKEGDIIIESDETRYQPRNKEIAIRRLNELINRALKKEKKRYPTKPSKGAKERRLEEKKRKSEIKKSRQKIKYY